MKEEAGRFVGHFSWHCVKPSTGTVSGKQDLFGSQFWMFQSMLTWSYALRQSIMGAGVCGTLFISLWTGSRKKGISVFSVLPLYTVCILSRPAMYGCHHSHSEHVLVDPLSSQTCPEVCLTNLLGDSQHFELGSED